MNHDAFVHTCASVNVHEGFKHQPSCCLQKREGAQYFSMLFDMNEPQVTALADGVRNGASMAQLRRLYSQARPAYEQMEVMAPAFPDQDEAIDARPYGFDEGVNTELRLMDNVRLLHEQSAMLDLLGSFEGCSCCMIVGAAKMHVVHKLESSVLTSLLTACVSCEPHVMLPKAQSDLPSCCMYVL